MVTVVLLVVLGLAACAVVLFLVRCRKPAMATPVGVCTPQEASAGSGDSQDEGGREWSVPCTRKKEQQLSKPFHSLYSKLSASSGDVNVMTSGQVKQRLRELRMEDKSVAIF